MLMKNWLLSFSLLIASLQLAATTHEVGPDKTYPNPNALYTANVVAAGDTILIDAADYRGRDALAVWSPDNLTIKGVGGQPKLYADGQYIWGKGIWVARGNNITVENIAFHDAAVPDRNGAGIRLDGNGLTVRHCLFRNNENGILTNNTEAGHVRVEFSEFDGAGFGDGQSHNIYVGRIDSFTFYGSWSHRANVGHQIKSRAKYNNIRYSRIEDDGGSSSRLIDLPNGGRSYVVGCLLVQGANAQNGNLVGYGLEGYRAGYERGLFVSHNTLVTYRNRGSFFHIREGADSTLVVNNILAGPGTLVIGELTDTAGTIKNDNLGMFAFTDPDAGDYSLSREPSLAYDAGMDLNVYADDRLIPLASYIDHLSIKERTVAGSAPDVGAFEVAATLSFYVDLLGEPVSIYPNPSTGQVWLKNLQLPLETSIEVIAISGKGMVLKQPWTGELNLSHLPSGKYLLRWETPTGKAYISRLSLFTKH